MSKAGRPFTPLTYVVDLNHIVSGINDQIMEKWANKEHIDIVIPVWQSVPEKIAKHMAFVLDKELYFSQRSQFVKFIQTKLDENTYYIFDRFKGNSHSYRKGYKQEMIEVPYAEEGEAEPIFLPVYWRVN